MNETSINGISKNTLQNEGTETKIQSFKNKIPKVEAILFDMDGVLRDVSQSYRTAIKKTVGKISGKDATDEEILKYKSLGINNDWELSYQILLNERKTFASYYEKIPTLSIITKVFQEFYLGNLIGGKFTGFIENEKFMADRLLLQKLKSTYNLGIVSTAPLAEILYSLRNADVDKFFPIIYSMEDLDETQEIPKVPAIKNAMDSLYASTACFLGDGISDMKAAVAAGIVPIGILPAGINDPTWESKLMGAGASDVFQNVNEAMDYFLDLNQ